MKQKSFKLLMLLLALVLIYTCSDPALIGSELLEEDQANLVFTDKVPINAKTIRGNQVQTFSPFTAIQLGNQLVGNFEDPVFGKSIASLYSQISIRSEKPDLDFAQFDSIILRLAYDTTGGFYGDLSQPFGLEVLRVEEDIVNTENYNSDQVFLTSSTPIGSVEFIPNLEEEVIIKDYTGEEPVDSTVAPHVSIRLDAALGEALLEDTLLYLSDTAFQNFFKGIYIRPTSAMPGMLSFDLNQEISRISLYYRSRQQLKEYQFDFTPANARVVNFSHDYENATVEPFLNGEADSLLFLQGMTGLNVEVTFPDLSVLEEIVVNKAELELTVATPIEDHALYPPSNQIVVSSNRDGALEVINDVRAALFGQQPINTDIFGGIPLEESINGLTLTKYKINISSHFQDIIEGRVNNNIILVSGTEQSNLYFQITPKAERASRTIFYGPNHSQFPLKLNLTYTKL